MQNRHLRKTLFVNKNHMLFYWYSVRYSTKINNVFILININQIGLVCLNKTKFKKSMWILFEYNINLK